MSRRQTVLVVEDDRKIALALEMRLAAAGYDVMVERDGTMGVLRALEADPDLILLDISLPAGNGFFVAEIIRADTRTKGLPIVFITASKRKAIRERASEFGPAAFLEKPFRSRDLLGILAEALAA